MNRNEVINKQNNLRILKTMNELFVDRLSNGEWKETLLACNKEDTKNFFKYYKTKSLKKILEKIEKESTFPKKFLKHLSKSNGD